MINETTRYSLQLRPVEMCHASDHGVLGMDHGVLEMEIVAHPEGPGQPISTRLRQWVPFFERLCALLSSSPFHRKAMHRTLRAGLSMHVLDRSNGEKLLFTHEEILALAQEEPTAA